MEIDKKKIKFEAPASALARWNPEIQAADTASKDVSINIYSTIGEYGDGSGMTTKIMSAILKKADGADVTVNVNSPGGDFFEGVAIHTLLSEYEGNVTVNVLGMAASAASIVALAGDTVNIAKAGFFMIHNAWTFAIGNTNDMTAAADMLAQFDAAMNAIYCDVTGLDPKAVKKMMDAETWISGADAVTQNFAQGLLGDENIQEVPVDKQTTALRKIDVALAKAGIPRSERRDLIKQLNGTPSAADDVKPSADELGNALAALLTNLKK